MKDTNINIEKVGEDFILTLKCKHTIVDDCFLFGSMNAPSEGKALFMEAVGSAYEEYVRALDHPDKRNKQYFDEEFSKVKIVNTGEGDYKKPVLIKEIDFLDVKVPIYYDPTSKKGDFSCSWRARNPESFYQGYVYMNNETGEITYPEDAVIPEQSEKDREILPKLIITNYREINDELIKIFNSYLESDYKRRNKNERIK